jgi:hypothetical protein
MTSAEGTDIDTLEMDTFSSTAHPPRSVSRGKSVSPGRALSRIQATRDYALGIGLLLIVVILWTSSNFVTQVDLSLSRLVVSLTVRAAGHVPRWI